MEYETGLLSKKEAQRIAQAIPDTCEWDFETINGNYIIQVVGDKESITKIQDKEFYI